MDWWLSWRSIPYRVVFNWVSKVISELLWFCITSLSDGFKVFAPFFQPIRIKNQNQSWLARAHFPALCVGCYVELLRVLIGLLDCLPPFWLAKVVTLVLVLRHSIETRSMGWICWLFILFRLKRFFPGYERFSLLIKNQCLVWSAWFYLNWFCSIQFTVVQLVEHFLTGDVSLLTIQTPLDHWSYERWSIQIYRIIRLSYILYVMWIHPLRIYHEFTT